ncbi:hypothetical protein [Streptomyces sp. CBMA156]|uniref:hypothetical protein n=1 Tax=Streptomyces sp. CBMA156 TaxID=1930280 RepID=UPI001661AFA1|nr:hypothetical protein [Streptomyces sp. CBMA156]MBD0670022.1 hypothetical protein [Streptomyces sp. CBMA156]
MLSPPLPLREGTREKYGYGLGLWIGFLNAVGVGWNRAGLEEIDGLKFWRMTDQAKSARVTGSTVLDDLGAVNAFYEWAEPCHQVVNPVTRVVLRRSHTAQAAPFEATPHVVRNCGVKWLDPGGYACWRDVAWAGSIGVAGRSRACAGATPSGTAPSPTASTGQD